MRRKIIAFHQDERLDWVADLECAGTPSTFVTIRPG